MGIDSPSAAAKPKWLLRSLLRIVWSTVILTHATLAALWWWRQPAGFPLTDAHFWVNTILPFIVVPAMLLARFPHGRWATRARPLILLGLAIIWISAGISSRFIFPISFEWLCIAPILVGTTIFLIWLIDHRAHLRRALLVTLLPATALGVVLPLSQRASRPDTRPLNIAPQTLATPGTAISSPRDIQLSAQVRVNVAEGGLWHQDGPYRLGLNPMLTFTSRSPDGCWVLFALPREREAPRRILRALQHQGNELRLLFGEDDLSALRVSASNEANVVNVESHARIPRIIWSHLNSFSELILIGHRQLFLSFSPCPSERVEVKPMDYPSGRPERIAYLAVDGNIHVVEAHSAEKGPYRHLASGPLPRGQPLGIMLWDQDVPIYRITFDDFSAQAGTQPSPTAGYGLPVNAIEFRLEGDDPSAPAAIFMTLASTSVGSGYDSVGHSTGIYRNRLTIERLQAPATSPSRQGGDGRI